MIRRGAALGLAMLVALGGAGGARAFEPLLPSGARLTAERASVLDVYDAPTGVFDGRIVPSVAVEGAIVRRAWRIDTAGLTPLQVMVPLRRKLSEEGYEVIFECEAGNCGGFDFRFNTEILPGPNMYVNISRFRHLTAVRGDETNPEAVVTVLASVTSGTAYVQIISADTGVDLEEVIAQAEQAPLVPAPVAAPIVAAEEDVLLEQGRVILDDLDFASGTSDLGPGPFQSLSDLAAILRDSPGLRVALVGHTDTVGDLETNIAISRARAQSVRDRLVSTHGLDPARLDAEGMGYLSPIASNRTEEGRTANRRVEAVLLNQD